MTHVVHFQIAVLGALLSSSVASPQNSVAVDPGQKEIAELLEEATVVKAAAAAVEDDGANEVSERASLIRDS